MAGGRDSDSGTERDRSAESTRAQLQKGEGGVIKAETIYISFRGVKDQLFTILNM